MSSTTTAAMSDTVAVVTGANSGMGKATAYELAAIGATVVLGCRRIDSAVAAAADIAAVTGNERVIPLRLDLASLGSVADFAAEVSDRWPALHVLVNNAAVSAATREESADGFEMHWATNVVGPHLLTQLLLPRLEASGQGRVVNVSTVAAGGLDLTDTQFTSRRFTGMAAYRASKQAVRMLTWAQADRYAGSAMTFNAVNPGYVVSPLTTNVGGLLKVAIRLSRFRAVTPREGADTAIWLASAEEVAGLSGRFWRDRREITCKWRNSSENDRVWNLVAQQLPSAVQS